MDYKNNEREEFGNFFKWNDGEALVQGLEARPFSPCSDNHLLGSVLLYF